jgi:tripeptide aminopeptidase
MQQFFFIKRTCMSFSIDSRKLIAELEHLCSLYGPSGKEAAVADYIVSRLEDLGIQYEFFPKETIPEGGDTPCLLAFIPGTGSTDAVLLSAHMDTVPVGSDKGFHIVREKNLVKSDGTTILGADDRAGVAAALEMARIASQNPNSHGGIELLFTVQEELGCRGVSAIPLEQLRASYGFNLDGETPPGSIIRQAPRKMRYTCTIQGRSAHAALEPEKGINAIRVAAEIITRLDQGQVDEMSTANIGTITGGRQTNVVAEEAQFTGEIRSFSARRCDELVHLITDTAKQTAEQWGATAACDWEMLYDGYVVGDDSRSVQRFRQACEQMDLRPELLRSPGGGDSNALNSRGIESVVFGLGMHQIHTYDEYLVIEEFVKATTLLAHVLFN